MLVQIATTLIGAKMVKHGYLVKNDFWTTQFKIHINHALFVPG